MKKFISKIKNNSKGKDLCALALWLSIDWFGSKFASKHIRSRCEDGYCDGDCEFSFFFVKSSKSYRIYLVYFFVPVLLSALLERFSGFPYVRFVRDLFFFFFPLLFYFRK